MDILISSNLERLLFELAGRDDALVREWMSSLAERGTYSVPETVERAAQTVFYGGCCDSAGTSRAIERAYSQYGYTLDPHTAVAFAVAQDYREETGDSTQTVIMSTASPFKFSGSVLSALGRRVAADEFENLAALSELTGLHIPEPMALLQKLPVRFSDVCDKGDMERAVLDILQKK